MTGGCAAAVVGVVQVGERLVGVVGGLVATQVVGAVVVGVLVSLEG